MWFVVAAVILVLLGGYAFLQNRRIPVGARYYQKHLGHRLLLVVDHHAHIQHSPEALAVVALQVLWGSCRAWNATCRYTGEISAHKRLHQIIVYVHGRRGMVLPASYTIRYFGRTKLVVELRDKDVEQLWKTGEPLISKILLYLRSFQTMKIDLHQLQELAHKFYVNIHV